MGMVWYGGQAVGGVQGLGLAANNGLAFSWPVQAGEERKWEVGASMACLYVYLSDQSVRVRVRVRVFTLVISLKLLRLG